jgi:transposase-like protein
LTSAIGRLYLINMTAQPSDVAKFPMDCPDCKSASGMPFMAATLPQGGTHVSLRCRECHHEWELEMQGRTLGPTGADLPDMRKKRA